MDLVFTHLNKAKQSAIYNAWWICCGSNFTYGLKNSNQFKFLNQFKIFEPV